MIKEESDMSYQLEMPKMGESITEGTIIKWYKNVGDMVSKDEIILEISTDKVDSEIPSPVSGRLSKIMVKEGEVAQVGSVIAQIETSEISEKEGTPESAKKGSISPEKEKVKQAKEETITNENAESVYAQIKQNEKEAAETKEVQSYSPLVLNIARTEGISRQDLAQIKGTGIQGRVTKNDILDYLKNRKKDIRQAEISKPPAAAAMKGGIEVIPMDHIRKKIAEHMVKTVHTSPHVGLYYEVNMNNVVLTREKNKNKFHQQEGFKLTYMPFIAEAVVKSLKDFPFVNSSIEGENIIVKHFINLGIAVAAPQGLIVPVIKNAESLNIVGLARAINDIATRARNKKLKPDDVIGGTFSISNFGVYGTTIGFPLINQPQLAILGIGALEKRPIVINDAIAIRSMMNIALVFDHRLIDGAMGAQFLKRLSEYLQDYNPDTSL
jgi:2-oxoglutarate dehydrogenase E2 component (dihydrolipoamide succinyltransferase)